MQKRSRLLSATALATAAVALTGCLATPNYNAGYNTYNNAYNAPNTYQTGAAVSPPANYYGTAQVVNVQTLQNGSAVAPQAAGAVIGGLAGGLVGNRAAHRSHSDRRAVATAGGAAVGALIGHYIQQNYSNYAGQPIYRVTVRDNNNNQFSFDYSQHPNVQIGERVQIQNGLLYRMP